MLQLTDVDAGYGSKQILRKVSLVVRAHEVVTLLGRNGMGKTTTVRTIMGMQGAIAGEIEFCGQRLTGKPTYMVARTGIALVPEGRQVFPTLTVRENLIATARAINGENAWTLDRVFGLFPRLEERQKNMGSQLSGGEQQMLAIGRALLTNPKLLILDEATEGLSPLVRDEIWNCLRALKEAGLALIIIDKNLDSLLTVADKHCIIEKGEIVWTGRNDDIVRSPEVVQRYLGV